MSVFFNMASLVLGLAAWVLACIAVIKRKPQNFSFLSFTFCVLSLVFQLCEINNRVNMGDFSAIMDTIRAVVLASAIMSGVTIVLNLTALIRAGGKNN